jgi:hypothetical protein
MTINVTARPRCLPLGRAEWRGARGLQAAAPGLMHLLLRYVVSREKGYSKYWERTRVRGVTIS